MIHLDTSFLIVALVRGSRQDRKLREWLGNLAMFAGCERAAKAGSSPE